MSSASEDPSVSALRKMDAWYQTLTSAERQVISQMVRKAVTPVEELAKEEVSGYASATCRAVASNVAPTILDDLSPMAGASATVFLIDGPPRS